MTECRSTRWALVVDDEPNIVELMSITLQSMGLDVLGAHSLADAYACLSEHTPPSLVLSDLRLPDGSGVDLVRRLHAAHPYVPVAVITAYSSADGAVEAMQAGAFDYMSKPIELTRLRRLVAQAVDLNNSGSVGNDVTARLVGDSSLMQQLREDIRTVARSNAPVHLTGESGTGKELAARAIHDSSPRHEKPFVAVNCGAIPEGLLESELFGAEKGAYSGATQNRQGLFLAANGGTLFLDEIGDLPMLMQVKLLRAIQERVVRPLGAAQEIPVDVRILSATHRDLDAMVHSGTFRQDLLYRLNVIQLHMPPLRQRLADLPQLVKVILQRIGAKEVHGVSALSERAMAKLSCYDFPGNVRELENLLERSLAFPDKDILDTGNRSRTDSDSSSNLAPDVLPSDLGVVQALDRTEGELLQAALQEAGGDAAAAARALEISLQSFMLRWSRNVPGPLS